MEKRINWVKTTAILIVLFVVLLISVLPTSAKVVGTADSKVTINYYEVTKGDSKDNDYNESIDKIFEADKLSTLNSANTTGVTGEIVEVATAGTNLGKLPITGSNNLFVLPLFLLSGIFFIAFIFSSKTEKTA